MTSDLGFPRCQPALVYVETIRNFAGWAPDRDASLLGRPRSPFLCSSKLTVYAGRTARPRMMAAS